MDNIGEGLRCLQAIEAIRRLKAAYCDACDDDHNGAAVAALFSERGSWCQVGNAAHVGREAIARHIFSIREAGGIARSAHLVTNPQISIDGEKAEGHWRFVMQFTATADGRCHRILGRYRDHYVFEEGRWLFASLLAEVEQRSVYPGDNDVV